MKRFASLTRRVAGDAPSTAHGATLRNVSLSVARHVGYAASLSATIEQAGSLFHDSIRASEPQTDWMASQSALGYSKSTLE